MQKDERKDGLAEEAAAYDAGHQGESQMDEVAVSTESKDAIARIVSKHRAALIRLADR
ncbi:MAG: hypothetical protein ACPGGK_02770 [Pikeienuella sp.]